MKDINITTTKSYEYTEYTQYPSALTISQAGLQTNGNYTEERYSAGSYTDIVSQRQALQAALPSTQQATFTITREPGQIYKLSVRYDELVQSPISPEAMQDKYGTTTAPETVSITVSGAQQSCLNHPVFSQLSNAQLGALAAYQAGKSPLDVGIDDNGQIAKLEDIMSRSDTLAVLACQYPTYQVPMTTIVLGYWAEEKETSSINGFTIVPSVAGITPPAGLSILYCGTTNQQVETGWQVQKTYMLGDFPNVFYQPTT